MSERFDDLPWTGERLVPLCRGQILYEHVHRYALAVELAKGKRILDIACGEGYGANLLARVATKVVGVDIDPATIAHARQAYQRKNLTFLEGACSDIPLKDQSVDLVVSFETIEHIEDHAQFLREIKRVLTPKGALIISSPDKREYSDRTGNTNLFHKLELYHAEFEQLLKKHFNKCRIAKQRLIAGSWIAPEKAGSADALGTFAGDIRAVEFEPGVREGVYSIAVCSDATLPRLKFGVFENTRDSQNIWHLLDQYSSPEKIQEKIGSLERAADQLIHRDAQIEQLRKQLNSQRQELVQVRENWTQLSRLLQEKSISIVGHEAQISRLTSDLRQQLQVTRKLSRLLDDLETAAVRLRCSRRWKLANPIAALKAKFSSRPELLDYGHLEKIVAAYSAWRVAHPEIAKIDDTIRALKAGNIAVGVSSFGSNGERAATFAPAVPTKPIEFIVADKIDISIVIPVFNQLPFTLACLASIQEHQGKERFEVIVVDDCSNDATANVIRAIPGVVYLRNESNRGFIASCNYGAAKARGDYLVFLNNDTTVTAGWLGALRETFQIEPNAGLVGSKLVYPDGRLQEAGGIIWRDASGWNRGKFQDPAKPEYNYLREVDYCSAASLMIPRELFAELGGFSDRYAPAYYEDTDLAFKVAQTGRTVLYQPLSVVVHYEGATGGTDLSAGIKKYQEANRATFAAAWPDVLAKKPINGDLALLECLKPGQKRVLVIDHHLPFVDRDAGSLRMFQILRILCQLKHQVTFVPDNLADIPPYGDELRKRGVEVVHHPYIDSVRTYLQENGPTFDVAILSRCAFAQKYIADVRTYAPQARLIFDTVDLHFLREEREAELMQDSTLKRKALDTRRLEYELIDQADETWVVSPVERRLLRSERPDKSIEVVPTIVDVVESVIPFDLRRDILFIGGFQHAPNVDAVIFFTREVLPIIRRKLVDLKFYVIGEKPPPQLIALGDTNIVITGLQANVSLYFNAIKISVAPLRFGAGVKGKINLSMAHGVPVVATSVAVEGMDLKDGHDVLLADAPEQFAKAVIELYQSKELWNRLSVNGVRKTQEVYSVEAAMKRLQQLMSNAHQQNTVAGRQKKLSTSSSQVENRSSEPERAV